MAGNDVVDARMCPQCKREFIVPMGGRESYVYKLRNSKRGQLNTIAAGLATRWLRAKRFIVKRKGLQKSRTGLNGLKVNNNG